ncbi:hypothetical protein DFP80_1049 [Marinomonas rhizomae]|uniref:Uncharacterized protein n=1 Tax=Marinomonas rhizomae TaxID=491948 RepID=A0A366JAP5_9GAMM|nr:hypothetical protein DFP80_1049 [Marinomonas rhizomae]
MDVFIKTMQGTKAELLVINEHFAFVFNKVLKSTVIVKRSQNESQS